MEKEYLIQKWLNDELTPAEHEAFKALEDYQFYVNIVDNAKQFKVSETSKVEDFEQFKQKNDFKNETPVRFLWNNPLLRIAAVLVLALGVYFGIFHNPETEVYTLVQQKTTFELPDASQVTLNALSEIKFNKNNWNQKREIDLKGEAFFRVQKGKTFDVVTSVGTVTVVGTEFSVKQRPDYFEVICYEGIVRVTAENTSQTLTAGETYRILEGKTSQSQTSELEPQWLENVSNFEAVPFSEVVNEMQRQYDIEIRLENIQRNPLFSGGFVHNNLDNALMSITQPLNLEFKLISPKQVTIYGDKK